MVRVPLFMVSAPSALWNPPVAIPVVSPVRLPAKVIGATPLRSAPLLFRTSVAPDATDTDEIEARRWVLVLAVVELPICRVPPFTARVPEMVLPLAPPAMIVVPLPLLVMLPEPVMLPIRVLVPETGAKSRVPALTAVLPV